MSTELEVRTPVEGATLPAKVQYAKMLADSGLLPKDYRRQPANILYAIEYGSMLGLSPMAAITGIHVIEGKPSASAGLISALVRRAGHKLRVTGNGKKAVCQIIRCDDPDYTFEVTWWMRKADHQADPEHKDDPDAETAGLLGKQVWKQYGASMLKARAITQCARDACEEALFGLHYTPEELGAEVDEDGDLVAEARPTFRGGDDQVPAGGDDPWTVPAEPAGWTAEAAGKVATLGTKDELGALYREAVAKRDAGEITGEDKDRICALIATRAEALTAEAEPVDGTVVEPLDPEDPWAAKVEEITDAEDAEAAEADVRTGMESGSIDTERGQRIIAAIHVKAGQFASEQVAA